MDRPFAVIRNLTQVAMGSRGNLSHASTFRRVNATIETSVSPRRAAHDERSIRVKEVVLYVL